MLSTFKIGIGFYTTFDLSTLNQIILHFFLAFCRYFKMKIDVVSTIYDKNKIFDVLDFR